MSAPRGIPTSRAYWDLQAEKLMNRIFDPVDTIDLPTDEERRGLDALPLPAPSPEEPAEPFPTEAAAKAPRWQRARRPQASTSGDLPAPVDADALPREGEPATPLPARGLQATLAAVSANPQPMLLIGAFAAAGLVSATSGVLALSQWNRFQESLQQERSLLLVERLRTFGPAAQAPATPPAPALAPPIGLNDPSNAPQAATRTTNASASQAQAYGQRSGSAENDLPPPPPQEPWIEQLSDLPRPQNSAPLLRVPVSPKLAAAAAPARPTPPPGPLPLLVGVVGAPGKVGSAIFQMGGSTSTVSVGEAIGNSGWRLRSTDGDSVQIEHAGDVRRIAIGSGG